MIGPPTKPRPQAATYLSKDDDLNLSDLELALGDDSSAADIKPVTRSNKPVPPKVMMQNGLNRQP